MVNNTYMTQKKLEINYTHPWIHSVTTVFCRPIEITYKNDTNEGVN